MDTFSKERERVQWCQKKRRIDLSLPQKPPDWKPARISWSPSLLLLRTTVPTHNRIGERPDDPSSSNWLWHLWGERGPPAPPPLPLLLPSPPPPTPPPPRHSATMHPKGSLRGSRPIQALYWRWWHHPSLPLTVLHSSTCTHQTDLPFQAAFPRVGYPGPSLALASPPTSSSSIQAVVFTRSEP